MDIVSNQSYPIEESFESVRQTKPTTEIANVLKDSTIKTRVRVLNKPREYVITAPFSIKTRVLRMNFLYLNEAK